MRTEERIRWAYALKTGDRILVAAKDGAGKDALYEGTVTAVHFDFLEVDTPAVLGLKVWLFSSLSDLLIGTTNIPNVSVFPKTYAGTIGLTSNRAGEWSQFMEAVNQARILWLYSQDPKVVERIKDAFSGLKEAIKQ